MGGVLSKLGKLLNSNIQTNGRKLLAGIVLLCWLAAVLSVTAANFLVPYVPKDFSYSADVTSVDNFYDEQLEKFSGPQYSVSDFSYRLTANKNGIANIDNTISVKTVGGAPIFAVTRNYAVDIHTGQHSAAANAKHRSGTLFAPRNLQAGEPFTYWHANYDGPAQMQFVDQEELFGVKVYRYQTKYEGVTIDQTADLDHLPGVPEKRGVRLEPYLQLWVEPVSGWLVKYQDKTTAYYYDIKTGKRLQPWNQFTNSFTDDSVARQAALAGKLRNQILILHEVVPYVLVITSIILLFALFKPRLIRAQVPFTGIVAMVMLYVIAVLLAWFLNAKALDILVPGPNRMNPMSALSFLLLGMCLFALRAKSSQARLLCWVCALLATAISVIRLLASVLPMPHIDLLLQQRITNEPIHMAYLSAAGLLLLSLAIMSLLRRRMLRIVATIAAAVIVLGVVGLVVDITTYVGQIKIPFFFSLSVSSALLLVVVASLVHALALDEQLGSTTLWDIGKRIMRFALISVPLIILLALAQFQQQASEARTEKDFAAKTSEIQTAIEARVKLYQNTLAGGLGLFESSDFVSRAEWKSYVNALDIQQTYPGIQGMGFIEVVKADQRQAFEKRVREEGFSDFTLIPPTERTEYAPVLYIEPFDERNQRVFGFDMQSEAIRKETIERARDTGTASISSKLILVQDKDTPNAQPGFLMVEPFYKRDMPTTTVAERQAAIAGYVYAPFRSSDFLKGALGKTLSTIGFTLYDGTETAELSELYSTNKTTDSQTVQDSQFAITRTFYLAGHPWTIRYAGTDITAQETSLSVMIVIIGGVFYLLVLLIVYSQINGRKQAIAYANQLTADLRHNQVSLSEAKQLAESKLQESERLNKLMVGREVKMLELKQRLKQFTDQGGSGVELSQEVQRRFANLEDTRLAALNLLEDIEAEKENFRKQGLETQKFALAVETSTDHIVITDSNGIIIYANPAVERISGFTPQEVIGKKVTSADLWSGQMDKAFYDDLWNTVKVEKQPFSADVQNRRKDGRPYLAAMTVTPIVNNEGQVLFFVQVERDITKEKEIDKAKTEFVSLASHQLRTPLTAIGWYTQLLTDGDAGKLTDPQLNLLKEIRDGNQRMVELVNSLLDVSRLELGTFAIAPEPTDIIAIGKSLVKEVELDIFKKKMDVREEYGELPKISVDPKLMRIIIQNLLTNAIKYTPEQGKVTLTIKSLSQQEIPQEYRLPRQDNILLIQVSDTGMGIPQHQHHQIFSKMFRADNVMSADVQGTGLGLYIVKSIVEYTGGRIWFTSQEGKGTTFTTILPLSGMQKKTGTRRLGD